MAYRKGTQGMMQVDYEERINFDRMREHRVSRIKHYMDEFDIDCLLLFDTGNKRYSTSTADHLGTWPASSNRFSMRVRR